ncbi:hypothetical protein L596_027151 [Steinernema carpocapsae]|uniref:Uncharacterized protein n=1 Tax=Steinernema carpocapsae TaxID=34508 RepID=A0A4U5M3H4_STECR|nr:hypothetical protein L596_027151 [Steinernema carpocapsae]
MELIFFKSAPFHFVTTPIIATIAISIMTKTLIISLKAICDLMRSNSQPNCYDLAENSNLHQKIDIVMSSIWCDLNVVIAIV